LNGKQETIRDIDEFPAGPTRIHRVNTHVIIAREPFLSCDLSLTAKGLLAIIECLRGRAENWRGNEKDLLQYVDTEDTLQSVIDELVSQGYLERS